MLKDRLIGFSGLASAINNIRKSGNRYLTNFFMPKPEIDKLIVEGKIYYYLDENAILIFVEEEFFFRFYYYSSTNDFLMGHHQVFSNIQKPLVMDIISKNEEVNLDVFYNAGFSPYKTFRRMSANKLEHDRQFHVEFARIEDKINIENALMNEFDIFSEHLPGQKQLETAISDNRILISKVEEDIAALLMFETIGISSTLNYWYTNKKYRGKGFGSQVFRAYANKNRDCKRFILWVDENKKNTIEKYKHFGYSFDGLTDYILIIDGD